MIAPRRKGVAQNKFCTTAEYAKQIPEFANICLNRGCRAQYQMPGSFGNVTHKGEKVVRLCGFFAETAFDTCPMRFIENQSAVSFFEKHARFIDELTVLALVHDKAG